MRYPILTNTNAVLNALRTDTVIDFNVEVEGSGVAIDLDIFSSIASDLRQLKENLSQSKDDLRKFDQLASEILGNKLKIDPAVAADERFWQLFSLKYCLDIVLWRWNKLNISEVPLNRFSGKWKDTFKRLWFRSFLTKDHYLDDSTEYCKLGGDDFWVGIIERELCSCKIFVKEILTKFFINNDGTLNSNIARETIKIARQIRANRMYETMNDQEVSSVIDHSIQIAIPLAKAKDNGKKKQKDSVQTPKIRKSKNRKKRK